MEDQFSGEKSVVRQEPNSADFSEALNRYRSLAAVSLVFGIAGMTLLPFGLLRFHQGAIVGGLRVPIFDESVEGTSLQALWLFCSSLSGATLGAVLFVGGIGGILMKRWSLALLRIWAVMSILFGVVGSYFFIQWLFVPWRESLAQVRGVDDALVNIGGWFVGSAFAIVLLVFTRRTRLS